MSTSSFEIRIQAASNPANGGAVDGVAAVRDGVEQAVVGNSGDDGPGQRATDCDREQILLIRRTTTAWHRKRWRNVTWWFRSPISPERTAQSGRQTVSSHELLLDNIGTTGHAHDSFDPQASVVTTTTLKPHKHMKTTTFNLGTMVDDDDDDYGDPMDYAQAPSTPGLVEKPELLSNAHQEVSDHLQT